MSFLRADADMDYISALHFKFEVCVWKLKNFYTLKFYNL